MDCGGYERQIRKTLSQLKAVYNVEMYMAMQKATVSGCIDRKKVIKVVRRCGKKAELWPYPYNVEYNSNTNRYYENEKFGSSYNFYKHGYSSSSHGYYQKPPYSTVEDKLADAFSDENPHTCRIM